LLNSTVIRVQADAQKEDLKHESPKTKGCKFSDSIQYYEDHTANRGLRVKNVELVRRYFADSIT